MNVSFTTKEYARLLELAHLGLHVATPRPDDEHATPGPSDHRYDEVKQKLLEHAAPMGCADWVDVGADGRLVPSVRLTDNDRLQKLIGAYNNDNFWHELVARLSDRDLAGQQARQSLAATGGPPIDTDTRLGEIEDGYWDEFQKNDLANLVLLRGGKG
jgi:hypothetical protein